MVKAGKNTVGPKVTKLHTQGLFFMTYDHNEVFFAELKGITELDQQNVAPNWTWSLGR